MRPFWPIAGIIVGCCLASGCKGKVSDDEKMYQFYLGMQAGLFEGEFLSDRERREEIGILEKMLTIKDFKNPAPKEEPEIEWTDRYFGKAEKIDNKWGWTFLELGLLEDTDGDGIYEVVARRIK